MTATRPPRQTSNRPCVQGAVHTSLSDIQFPDPVHGTKPSQPNGRDRRLRDGEEERLLKAAGSMAMATSHRRWLVPALVISVETCMRQSELVGTKWKDVHLDVPKPHIYLPAEIVKSRKPCTVPLSPRAIAAFNLLKELPDKERDPDRPIPVEAGRSLLEGMKDAIAFERQEALMLGKSSEETDALFDELVWHDLRHEGISRLFERTDLRDAEIMAISGHTGKDMLVRYTHLRAAELAKRLGSNATDQPGTVRIAPNMPAMVLATSGKWIALTEADQLTRAWALNALKDVLENAEKLEAA